MLPIARETLEGGVQLWHLRIQEAQLVHIRLITHSGAQSDGAIPGITEVVARASLIDAQPGDTGLDTLTHRANIALEREATVFRVEVARDDAPAALARLARMVRSPSFRKPDIQQAIASAKAARGQARTEPSTELAASALWWDGAWLDRTELSSAIEDWRCRAHHKKIMRPDKVAIVVVGDVPLETVRQRLNAAFDGWTAPRTAENALLQRSAPAALMLIDSPGPARRALLLARSTGPASPEDAAPALWIAARILERRLSQGQQSAASVPDATGIWTASPTLSIAATVEVHRVHAALAELRQQRLAMTKTPPTIDEVRRARGDMNNLVARVLGAPSPLADVLEFLARSRSSENALGDLGSRIAAVTPEAVSSALRDLALSDEMRVLVVAPRLQIEDALRPLGPIDLLNP